LHILETRFRTAVSPRESSNSLDEGVALYKCAIKYYGFCCWSPDGHTNSSISSQQIFAETSSSSLIVDWAVCENRTEAGECWVRCHNSQKTNFIFSPMVTAKK